MRVSNNKARDMVDNLEEFQGSNTFAEWSSMAEDNQVYKVYSYGHHFPMYIYDAKEKKWVGNKDKFSRSTTRHQSLLRPSANIDLWLSTDDMHQVINKYGIVGYLIHKAQH